jgi:spore coat polysaccharide biosynthesis predicted glycosyltransferase SpsG
MVGCPPAHAVATPGRRGTMTVSGGNMQFQFMHPANRAAVIAHAAARPRITIHEHKNSLAPLLAATDLAIGAVGGTTWERMFLGIPTIASIMAENQQEIARALSRAGLLVLVGEAQSVQTMSLTAALSSLLGDPSLRQRMADAGQALVDGLGVQRIVDRMVALSL